MGGLRVGMLAGEPAGMICTRSAGAVEFEASLQWEHPAEPVLHRIPRTGAVRYDLRETFADGVTADGVTSIRGLLLSTDERALRDALDAALRALTEAAALGEAALRTSAARLCRAASPPSGAVEALARRMWSAGLGVGFGASWSPAPAGADVAVGCRGAEREVAFALSGMDRPRVTG